MLALLGAIHTPLSCRMGYLAFLLLPVKSILQY